MEESNNNSVVTAVILTILVMVVLGLVGFIVYDKVINKTNEPSTGENNKVDNGKEGKEEVKEISINDSLITSLVYPVDVLHGIGYAADVTWDYRNINVDNLTREEMMHAAAFELEPVSKQEHLQFSIYSANDVEQSYKNMFGPDTQYTNGNIECKVVNGQQVCECCQIYEYDAKNKTYTANCGCGGDAISTLDRITKKYKAEQMGDYIYVYEYVQSVRVRPEDENDYNSDPVAYLLDHNDKETTKIEYDNYENTIYSMIDKGEVDTYKWTFKKQSDGKYYFYSGAWEN